jgi:hypothetical protein
MSTNQFGVKRPDHFSVDDYARAGLDFAIELHKYIYGKLGVDHFVVNPRYFGSGHLMGNDGESC